MTKHDHASRADIGRMREEILAYRALRASVGLSRRASLSLIFIGLLVSWLLSYVTGGAEVLAPHWYYLPILFAATRFGPLAALIVACMAGVIAGPLTPADVETGRPQELVQWLSRAGFFILIGQVSGWLLSPLIRHPLAEEVRRLSIEHRIRSAIHQREFHLVYQPIHSIAQGRHVGVEALIRWIHPTLGMIAPDEFMSVAEETDLIHAISDFVLEEACRQAAEWRRLAHSKGCEPWQIAVNLSARDMDRPELARVIEEVLARHELPPELLILELTESALALDGSSFQLYQLRKLGIRLAVDDFGTGYSSLSYLDRFPVDILKIDQTLVAKLGPEESSQRLTRAIVGLANAMELTTIAEGIETAEQLEIGRQIGFDLVQGYHFERPQAGEDIPALMLAPGTPASNAANPGRDRHP
ncbi:EAL domain-containing protein [Wenzhouxiangella sp. XN201]|uniref:EAL domain-containing protein n=1 Tax=Wenzhouxiangella sp. XN201 TaxID=2710755 RepID=UPI0013CAAB7A|nr:EAL domain-containing protein [Wenzhouxiangella sp. XN201]